MTAGRVAVVGAGVIGTSVAYACLEAGHDVVLVDTEHKDWSAVSSALVRHHRLARLSSRSTGSVDSVDVDDIRRSHELTDVEGCQVIIENVTEEIRVKRQVYAELRSLDVAGAVIAANTSAIPIDRLAEAAPDATRVVGVHFMNPVSSIDMVELVRGPRTSDETLDIVVDLLASMGKRGVVVDDSPGFVINRILMVMVNQAVQLADEGVATPHEIDELLRGCLGHAMGPLRTADLIGIDTIVRTLAVLLGETGDPMFEPAGGLLAMVERGQLGMKSGSGFYEYGKGRTRA